MGGLFDSGTKQVQQQPTTSPLSDTEVSRLSAITGQQQRAGIKKRQQPRTVLGTPVQAVGNTSPSTYGLSNG